MTDISYTILRSRRKTLALQITPAGEVLVRCPSRCSQRDIRAFVDSKQPWLEKHLAAIRSAPALPPFTSKELASLAARAKAVIPPRVAHHAALLGVSYGRVTIRAQHTRWGSCSAKGNLNFNCLLVLCPPEVLDYIILHELCHRLEFSHTPAFWALVARACPAYRLHIQWLRENGSALIARLPQNSKEKRNHL